MERILKVSCNATYCSYAGRFRIYIASNGFEELAQQKGITVDPFIKIDT